MPIPVVCPGCAVRLNAPDAAAGKAVKCPKCKVTITVPAPPAAAGFEVVEDEPAPAAKTEAPVRPAPTRKPAAEDEEAESRPQKKTRPERDADEDEDRPKKKKPRDEDEEDDQPRKKRPVRDEADEDAPRKKKKPARDEDEEEDDRPNKKNRKDEKKGGGLVVILVGVVGGLFLLSAAGFAAYWFGFRDQGTETVKPSGGDGKTNPPQDGPSVTNKWKEYAANGPGFRAMFPWDAAIEGKYEGGAYADMRFQPNSVPGVITTLSVYSQNYVPNAPPGDVAQRFTVVAVFFRPKVQNAEREAALDEIVNSEARTFKVKEGEAKTVTWGGREAKELTYTGEAAADGKTRRIVFRRLMTDSVGYVSIVIDKGELKPKEYALFNDSFEPRFPKVTTEPPTPPKKATLPPAPAGWVPYADFAKRFTANVPPGGEVTVNAGRLAYLDEVGKGDISDGIYYEMAFKDRGLKLSVRLLNFASATPAATRATLLDAYVRRSADPRQKNPAVTKLKWSGLDVTEEATEAEDAWETRRFATGSMFGFVVTIRGTNRKEYDDLKATMFDNLLVNTDISASGHGLLAKGWSELSSAGGMFRVEMPGPPTKTDELDKVLADAKLTGEFHTTTADGLTFHAGYVKYAAGATADDKRRARESLAVALSQVAAGGLPKPITLVAVPNRNLLAWEEYQRRGTATQPGFQVRFHEFEGGCHVLSARGIGVFTQPEKVRFTQFFALLY